MEVGSVKSLEQEAWGWGQLGAAAGRASGSGRGERGQEARSQQTGRSSTQQHPACECLVLKE